MTTDGTASARPRLVDVAERAGVSTATASLVLRGRPGPSASTADAVRAAAADLGYRPDRTASLLARRRTHLLGVLLDVTSPFHADLVRALDTASADRGSTWSSGRRRRAPTSTAPPRRCSTSAARRSWSSARRCPTPASMPSPRPAPSSRSGGPARRGSSGSSLRTTRDSRPPSTTSRRWATGGSPSPTVPAAASPGLGARATGTRWRGTASAPTPTWSAVGGPRRRGPWRPTAPVEAAARPADGRRVLQRPGGHRPA